MKELIMQKQNLEQVFYASLKFGINEVNKVIIAKNKNDAITTIFDYYSEPIILGLISIAEIIELLNELEKNENMIISLDVIPGDNGLKVVVQKEISKSIEEIKEYYKDKDTLIIKKEGLLLILNSVLLSLKNNDENLIYSSFDID